MRTRSGDTIELTQLCACVAQQAGCWILHDEWWKSQNKAFLEQIKAAPVAPGWNGWHEVALRHYAGEESRRLQAKIAKMEEFGIVEIIR